MIEYAPCSAQQVSIAEERMYGDPYMDPFNQQHLINGYVQSQIYHGQNDCDIYSYDCYDPSILVNYDDILHADQTPYICPSGTIHNENECLPDQGLYTIDFADNRREQSSKKLIPFVVRPVISQKSTKEYGHQHYTTAFPQPALGWQQRFFNLDSISPDNMNQITIFGNSTFDDDSKRKRSYDSLANLDCKRIKLKPEDGDESLSPTSELSMKGGRSYVYPIPQTELIHRMTSIDAKQICNAYNSPLNVVHAQQRSKEENNGYSVPLQQMKSDNMIADMENDTNSDEYVLPKANGHDVLVTDHENHEEYQQILLKKDSPSNLSNQPRPDHPSNMIATEKEYHSFVTYNNNSGEEYDNHSTLQKAYCNGISSPLLHYNPDTFVEDEFSGMYRYQSPALYTQAKSYQPQMSDQNQSSQATPSTADSFYQLHSSTPSGHSADTFPSLPLYYMMSHVSPNAQQTPVIYTPENKPVSCSEQSPQTAYTAVNSYIQCPETQSGFDVSPPPYTNAEFDINTKENINTGLETLSAEYQKLLKNIPKKSKEAFTPSDIAAFRTCHPHYSRNCYILMQNGYDIRLGEVGRAALKKEISRRLRADTMLREKCVSVICRLKNANVLQLLQMAEIAGCLGLGLRISSCYWKEYLKKQHRPGGNGSHRKLENKLKESTAVGAAANYNSSSDMVHTRNVMANTEDSRDPPYNVTSESYSMDLIWGENINEEITKPNDNVSQIYKQGSNICSTIDSADTSSMLYFIDNTTTDLSPSQHCYGPQDNILYTDNQLGHKTGSPTGSVVYPDVASCMNRIIQPPSLSSAAPINFGTTSNMSTSSNSYALQIAQSGKTPYTAENQYMRGSCSAPFPIIAYPRGIETSVPGINDERGYELLPNKDLSEGSSMTAACPELDYTIDHNTFNSQHLTESCYTKNQHNFSDTLQISTHQNHALDHTTLNDRFASEQSEFIEHENFTDDHDFDDQNHPDLIDQDPVVPEYTELKCKDNLFTKTSLSKWTHFGSNLDHSEILSGDKFVPTLASHESMYVNPVRNSSCAAYGGKLTKQLLDYNAGNFLDSYEGKLQQSPSHLKTQSLNSILPDFQFNESLKYQTQANSATAS